MFFASLVGIGSTTELLQFFFGEMTLSDFLRKWLDAWEFYNEKFRIILQPVANLFVRFAAFLGLKVDLNPIWVNFFWIFLIPSLGSIRLLLAILPSKLPGQRSAWLAIGGCLILFALLLALFIGSFPSQAEPYKQALVAASPVIAIPPAGLIAVLPLLLLVGLGETIFRGFREGAKVFFGGIWTLLPGVKYLRFALIVGSATALPVWLLAHLKFPPEGQALFVYYMWLLALGVLLLFVKPKPAAAERNANVGYYDVRPLGMFILGGFCLTVTVLFVDYIFRT